MHIAHLARTNNELLAPPLEDKLRFVFREYVRGAIVLLRQLLLPLNDFAGEANNDIVLVGLSVNRDGAERGAFDPHGLILGSYRIRDQLIRRGRERLDFAQQPTHVNHTNGGKHPIAC